jgi:hypothetical protein
MARGTWPWGTSGAVQRSLTTPSQLARFGHRLVEESGDSRLGPKRKEIKQPTPETRLRSLVSHSRLPASRIIHAKRSGSQTHHQCPEVVNRLMSANIPRSAVVNNGGQGCEASGNNAVNLTMLYCGGPKKGWRPGVKQMKLQDSWFPLRGRHTGSSMHLRLCQKCHWSRPRQSPSHSTAQGQGRSPTSKIESERCAQLYDLDHSELPRPRRDIDRVAVD